MQKKGNNEWILSATRITREENQRIKETGQKLVVQAKEVSDLFSDLEGLKLEIGGTGVPGDLVGLIKQCAMDCAMWTEGGKPKERGQRFSGSSREEELESRVIMGDQLHVSERKITVLFDAMGCKSVGFKPLQQGLSEVLRQREGDEVSVGEVVSFLVLVDRWQREKNKFYNMLRKIDKSRVEVKRKLEEPYTTLQKLQVKEEKDRSEGVIIEGEAEKRDELKRELDRSVLMLRQLDKRRGEWEKEVEAQTEAIARKIARIKEVENK